MAAVHGGSCTLSAPMTPFEGLSFFLIGNPGAGKSSLINCYVQQLLFKSGMSANAFGVTHQLEVKEHDGRRYMDTPGLSDLKLRQAAAESIDKALQQGGDFKVMFVMTTEAGRLKPDDLTTMKLVLQAANQIKENQYSVLINKISRKWKNKTLKLHEWMATFRKSLKDRDIPVTDYVHFAPFLEDLEDGDDVVAELDEETQRFIDNAPSFNIKRDKVQNVEYHTFEELYAKYEKQLGEMEAAKTELEKKNNKLAEEMQRQEEAKKAELDWMEKERHAEIQRFKEEKRAELARLEAEHQREKKKAAKAELEKMNAAKAELEKEKKEFEEQRKKQQAEHAAELKRREEATKAELERVEREKKAEKQRFEEEKRAMLARQKAEDQRRQREEQRERACAAVKGALAGAQPPFYVIYRSNLYGSGSNTAAGLVAESGHETYADATRVYNLKKESQTHSYGIADGIGSVMVDNAVTSSSFQRQYCAEAIKRKNEQDKAQPPFYVIYRSNAWGSGSNAAAGLVAESGHDTYADATRVYNLKKQSATHAYGIADGIGNVMVNNAVTSSSFQRQYCAEAIKRKKF